MRTCLLGGAAAMVFVSLMPVGYGTAAMAATRRAPVSPVSCNSDEDYTGSRGRIHGARMAKIQPRMVPPPNIMPPLPVPVPPPPAEAMPAAPSDMVVVEGNRAAAEPMQAFPDKSIAESLNRIAPVNSPEPDLPNAERYQHNPVSAVQRVADTPVSTFSVDVDTASYANVRRMLKGGETPPSDAVRTEEMLNYFRYDYPLPADKTRPFSITTNVTTTPWNAKSRLLRVGLRAYDVPRAKRPAANLVFLVDVSGSMDEPDKLPLVKSALGLLADNLRPDDKVSIVVYAGAAGIVLKPTSNGKYVHQALECLAAGGSTAGGAGLSLAYATAKAAYIPGGINRVILATDGDFNVGTSDDEGLLALVKKKMEGGITLTTLGFGEGNTNDEMMEKIADAGNGNYAFIDSATEAHKVLDDELQGTLFTVAKDVKIQVEFNPACVSQYRLIGYEDRALKEQDFNNDKVDAGDIGAGHQVTAIYEIIPAGTDGWVPERHFDGNRAPAADGHGDQAIWLKLRYKLPNEDTSRLIEQAIPTTAIAGAKAPTGDMAFAASVAAYGQILRGDTTLGDFTMKDVRSLAGTQNGYLRGEFVELTKLAETGDIRH